jgi:hypothetical protein
MICSAFSRSGRTSDGDEMKMRIVGSRSGIAAREGVNSPHGSGASGQLLPRYSQLLVSPDRPDPMVSPTVSPVKSRALVSVSEGFEPKTP